MIRVDGAVLEGGGQIVRTAIALSAVTGKPVRVFNIRKGRKKPGLRPQHLGGIAAASRICDATVSGLKIGSLEVTFSPTAIAGGAYSVDIRTAGSATLILQILIPVGIYADSLLKLTIKGGTAVPYSPTVEYVRHVTGFFLKRIHVSLTLSVLKHGFYPGGGGEINATVKPGSLHGIELLDRGPLKKMSVLAVASEHLKNALVAERMINGFQERISDADVQHTYVHTLSPGCFIQSFAHFENCILGADALGKKGMRAEDVGRAAARSMKKEIDSEATIDTRMLDQIIPYIALAASMNGTTSRIKVPRLSKHAETNMWVVKKFLPVDFELKHGILTCYRM
jgi:RNA 3'-terminal phosphate cyclase (ATP)